MKHRQKFKHIFSGLLTLATLNAPLMGNISSQSTPQSPRDYPRELGSAAEMHIEEKNKAAKDLPDAKRDKLHPDVDEDQDVEYMFEESEVWQ